MSYDDETPSSSQPEESNNGQSVYQLSQWVKRVSAVLTDSALLLLILFIGGQIAQNSFLLSLLVLVVFFGFGFWQLWKQGVTGQAIGKKAIGIKLVSELNAQVVGGWYSVARAFVHIVDFLPFLVGFVWPIWDAKRQTFADKIMKTVVIDT